MPAVDLKVYGAILSVRPARRFDIACLLMRMYGYMMNIGTVAMLSLAGYSFLESGLVSSVIALAIFLIGPRLGKLVDERGQSRVVPFAALVSLTGLVALLITVQFHGSLWILFIASVFVGCIPSAQALSRARWVYLLRMGKLGEKAPNITTIFSYEGILDDIGFMIAPALSIFLASSFTPIAGLAVGGVSFLIGATLLTHAKETEPRMEIGRGYRFIRWSNAQQLNARKGRSTCKREEEPFPYVAHRAGALRLDAPARLVLRNLRYHFRCIR